MHLCKRRIPCDIQS